jgi:hypothetical protein
MRTWTMESSCKKKKQSKTARKWTKKPIFANLSTTTNAKQGRQWNLCVFYVLFSQNACECWNLIFIWHLCCPKLWDCVSLLFIFFNRGIHCTWEREREWILNAKRQSSPTYANQKHTFYVTLCFVCELLDVVAHKLNKIHII